MRIPTSAKRLIPLIVLLTAFVPSLARAASDVTLEVTNRTSDRLLMTSARSSCMEIPWKTVLAPHQLTKIKIDWNGYGSCRINDSYANLEFMDIHSKRGVGNAHLTTSHDKKLPFPGNWHLSTSPAAGICMPINGYDQIAILRCAR